MAHIIETKLNEPIEIYINEGGVHKKILEIPAIGGFIIGSNVDASKNVRLFRSADGKIQIVTGDDTTVEGSASVNLADLEVKNLNVNGIIGCTGINVNGTVTGSTGAFSGVSVVGTITGATGVYASINATGIKGITGAFNTVNVVGTITGSTGVYANINVTGINGVTGAFNTVNVVGTITGSTGVYANINVTGINGVTGTFSSAYIVGTITGTTGIFSGVLGAVYNA